MEGHASTWHDGGVALRTLAGEIVALAAERVGDRYKHSWNSRLAYDWIAQNPLYASSLGGAGDHFVDAANGLVHQDHHLFHAASAYFSSGWDSTAVLVMDGQGHRDGHLSSTSIWAGAGGAVAFIEEHHPTSETFAGQSLGHFYSSIGALAGMKGLYDEGKTMALAAYGRPSDFLEWLRERVYAADDGTYVIDPAFVLAVLGHTFGPEYFEWPPQPDDVCDLWEEVIKIRGQPLRPADAPVSQIDMDTAFAGQVLLEEMICGLACRAQKLTGASRLCLSGGVALNCVANQRIASTGIFEDVHIGPVPADDGQALGKLLLRIAQEGGGARRRALSPYLGPRYQPAEIDRALGRHAGQVRHERLIVPILVETIVDALEAGRVVALWQGQSEIGPRALGHRSIIADARFEWMRAHLNSRVKDREWYRPIAPIVMEEHAARYFMLDKPSPYMARAVPVRGEMQPAIPSGVHVDGSARVQTVNRAQEPFCYEILCRYLGRTGIPLLLNTSFNRRNEPLVETPDDALADFIEMEIDLLVLDDRVVLKT
ncbi:carbamoyltransferase C-terminal domain-containing protein [Conexibacter sp. CPCC 206217]|uniref:carbamoyltransferase family protein n=1 Tax=Conexibacter sp. CPCC 206217 TaxID=3064574 RepID=UPI00271A1BAC|nr:carbamoyltransferase C-terminal domain-containing protein [Conexibacter sp. CPCC 206217]MDO8209868.1 carbamoyltransferase C-terminal domain-containing protein [Conexibacter sp. CPCC 206217]